MARIMAKRTGILGGSFDPPHLGHLLIAEQARDQLELDSVVFVPAGRPPHKTSPRMTDAMSRRDMVEAAITRNSSFQLSTSDLDLAAPSFTFELLERLADTRTHGQLVFIMGEDSLYEFGTWKNPERILELASLAVARRPLSPHVVRRNPNVSGLARRLEWITAPPCGISSTDIRDRVQTGQSIRYMVPDEVRSYIEVHGIYSARTDDGTGKR